MKPITKRKGTGNRPIRTVVALVVAFCVATMLFAGSASAQLGVVDQDLKGELTESGGSGSGTVALDGGDQADVEGTGAAGGDVQEQEVNILLEGDGTGPNDVSQRVMVSCTITPESVQEGLFTSGACTTIPLNPGQLAENPAGTVGLGETLVRNLIQNPEASPDVIGLVLLLAGLSGTVPTDQIPWDQIPWDQIPNDQIPVDQIPELNDEIPWDQIPNDEVPLNQPA